VATYASVQESLGFMDADAAVLVLAPIAVIAKKLVAGIALLCGEL